MKMNLVFDGNAMFYKNVFTLHKINELHGNMWQSLVHNVNRFRNMADFERVFFVSDSRLSSWRKTFYPEYKEGRKKDVDIDWDFAYTVYEEFKSQLKEEGRVNVLEYPQVEGDDWISLIVKKSNANGVGVMTVASDHDLLQLLDFDVKKEWLNCQVRDIFDREVIFLPTGYELLMEQIEASENPIVGDIFDMGAGTTWGTTLKDMTRSYSCKVVDSSEILFRKIIEGDSSDNISSLYETTQNMKDGGTRQIGLGEATGEKMWKMYSTVYPNSTPKDYRSDEFLDRILPIIETVKKVSIDDSGRKKLKNRLDRNLRLIELHHRHLPEELLPKISDVLKELF